jgi:signal transduction histidine kinase
MADSEALNKIFSNLFSNAVKYAGNEVYIKMEQPARGSDYLTIEIRNDGFVIPKEMRGKVFEPFYRLKETMKQKGTGIGLALARSLVELHKGHLFMKESEDNLNVFVVRIPYYHLLPGKRKKESDTTQLARTN